MLKSTRNSQNRYFYHIFCFPWGRPWGNHAKCCMDGKRIRCLQIVLRHVPMYLQQFPRYSNRKCKKAIFTYRRPHFCFPWGRPWGNHAKCCMDGKRTRCLQIVSLHVPIYLLPFLRYSEIFVKKNRHFIIRPCIRRPRWGVPVGISAPPLGWKKLEWCRYPMVKKIRRYLYSFWRDPRTWRTDTAWQQRPRLHRIAR